MPGPLRGIRILDFTTLTAGGEASGFLCDLGADIIKVEPREGEAGRRITQIAPGVSTFFLPQNRGKRSIVLDIRKPEGRGIALRIAERCDALMHNFRPGVMERLGLGYKDIRRVNPSIVYAANSAFGSEGPDAGLPAVDIIGQARGGIMAVTGDSSPMPVGAIVSDYTAAMHLAIGVLAALLHRANGGGGQRVEGSMLGSLISLQGWEITHYLVTGQTPPRAGRGHQLLRGLWGVYDTNDGHIALAGVAPAKLSDLAQALACPELRERHFADETRRAEVMDDLRTLLSQEFRRWKTAELCRVLTGIDIRCAPVQNYEQLARDPQVKANAYIVGTEIPHIGQTRMAGNPLRFSETPLDIASAAPELGQDTESVLRWAGFTDADVELFREREVI